MQRNNDSKISNRLIFIINSPFSFITMKARTKGDDKYFTSRERILSSNHGIFLNRLPLFYILMDYKNGVENYCGY